jgi:Spy/CpxP family protein refolding chaperone
MFKAVGTVLVFAATIAVAASLSAQERHGRRDGPRGQGGFDRIERMLKPLNLTEEQKTKVAALKKDYEPKFKELGDKRDGILTAEQKKARDDAMKAAKDEGKKGFDVIRAGFQAVKLTDEQKAKMKELGKEARSLIEEVMGKVTPILTAEQKEQLEKARKRMEERMPRMS